MIDAIAVLDDDLVDRLAVAGALELIDRNDVLLVVNVELVRVVVEADRFEDELASERVSVEVGPGVIQHDLEEVADLHLTVPGQRESKALFEERVCRSSERVLVNVRSRIAHPHSRIRVCCELVDDVRRVHVRKVGNDLHDLDLQ